ncbi:hypothetical protein AC1031_021176 [Aphanomyces cochlioides]|nr:hypothetical protein AC1031_021176 [Aphanomyces cochlioides]
MQVCVQSAAPVLVLRESCVPKTLPVDSFFTVDEDLCLVRQKCFVPPEFPSDAAFRLAFCTAFHNERTIEQLNQRFEQLAATNPEHGILHMYLNTLVRMRDANDHAILTWKMLKQEFIAFAAMPEHLRVLLASSTLHQQDDNDEILLVQVVSKKFPSYDLNVSKTQFRKSSHVIDRFLDHAANSYYTNGTLTFQPAGAGHSSEVLIITDDVEAYDAVKCYDHLSQPVVERLVRFAKDPDAVDRRMRLSDAYSKIDKATNLCSDEINDLYTSELKRSVQLLDQDKQFELAQVTTVLEQALTNDLAALHAMHAAALQTERAKIHCKYSGQRDVLVERIEMERQKALELYRDSTDVTLLELEHAMAVNNQQVEAVFGSSDCLLPLLILADDFECTKLRKSCIHYLTEPGRFAQFALRRELTCPLLAPSTILGLLQHLSDQDAQDLKGSPTFPFADLLVREVHTRLIALTKQLEALSHDALRQIMRFASSGNNSDSGLPLDKIKLGEAARAYPFILTKELERRRQFSSVKLNASLVSCHMNLTDDELAAELVATNRYCTALGTKARRAGEFGKWMFEARIEELDAGGGSIAIGWEVPRKALQWNPSDRPGSDGRPASPRGLMPRFGEMNGYGVVLPGMTASEDGSSFGIMWQTEASLHGDGMGILYINGKQHSGVPCFCRGDVVGCTINQDANEPHVEFYLNGQLAIPVQHPSDTKNKHYDDHDRTMPVHSKLSIRHANYALFPAVTLFSSNDPNARVRFNFRGHFEFPIPGFDPYGAELLDLIDLASSPHKSPPGSPGHGHKFPMQKSSGSWNRLHRALSRKVSLRLQVDK